MKQPGKKETGDELCEYLSMADDLAHADWRNLTISEIQFLFLQHQRNKYMQMARGDLPNHSKLRIPRSASVGDRHRGIIS